MRRLRIQTDHAPRPMLRPRATVRGRHATVYTDPKSKGDIQRLIESIDTQLPDDWQPWEKGQPIHVHVSFLFEIPKSRTELDDYDYHTQKPDADNLTKLVLDAITQHGGIWDDDAQVVTCNVIKRWNTKPGTLVIISDAL